MLPSVSVSLKLPKLMLDKFDGNPLEWPEWSGQFLKTVDGWEASQSHKMQYMNTLVTCNAKAAIEGMGNFGQKIMWLGRHWNMILADQSWLWMRSRETFMHTLSSNRMILWKLWSIHKWYLNVSMSSINLDTKWILLQSQSSTVQSENYQMTSKTSGWHIWKDMMPATRTWECSVHSSRKLRKYKRTSGCNLALQLTQLERISREIKRKAQALPPQVIHAPNKDTMPSERRGAQNLVVREIQEKEASRTPWNHEKMQSVLLLSKRWS